VPRADYEEGGMEFGGDELNGTRSKMKNGKVHIAG